MTVTVPRGRGEILTTPPLHGSVAKRSWALKSRTPPPQDCEQLWQLTKCASGREAEREPGAWRWQRGADGRRGQHGSRVPAPRGRALCSAACSGRTQPPAGPRAGVLGTDDFVPQIMV